MVHVCIEVCVHAWYTFGLCLEDCGVYVHGMWMEVDMWHGCVLYVLWSIYIYTVFERVYM